MKINNLKKKLAIKMNKKRRKNDFELLIIYIV